MSRKKEPWESEYTFEDIYGRETPKKDKTPNKYVIGHVNGGWVRGGEEDLVYDSKRNAREFLSKEEAESLIRGFKRPHKFEVKKKSLENKTETSEKFNWNEGDFTISDGGSKSFSNYSVKSVPANNPPKPPTAAKPDKGKTGQGYTGEKKDSRGHTICYSDGIRTTCAGNEEGVKEDEAFDKEWDKVASEHIDETEEKEKPGHGEGGEKEEPKENPQDKLPDDPFDSEWDKIVSEHIDEVEKNDVRDHEYTPQQVAQEQNWHKQVMDYKRNGGKTPPGAVSRFISGLANSAVGTLEYISSIIDENGDIIAKTPKEITDELKGNLDKMNPNGPANGLIASLVGGIFGMEGAGVAKKLAGEEKAKQKETDKARKAEEKETKRQEKNKPKEVKKFVSGLSEQEQEELNSEYQEALKNGSHTGSFDDFVANQLKQVDSQIDPKNAPALVQKKIAEDPKYAAEWKDKQRRVAVSKNRGKKKGERQAKFTPEQKEAEKQKSEAKREAKQEKQIAKSAAFWKRGIKKGELSLKDAPPEVQAKLNENLREKHKGKDMRKVPKPPPIPDTKLGKSLGMYGTKKWVTIEHTHVLLDGAGDIVKGPNKLVGKTPDQLPAREESPSVMDGKKPEGIKEPAGEMTEQKQEKVKEKVDEKLGKAEQPKGKPKNIKIRKNGEYDKKTVKETLGFEPTEEKLASALGLPDNSEILIDSYSPGAGAKYKSIVECEITGEGYSATRRFKITPKGERICENVLFIVNEQGKGLGAEIFSNQVNELSKQGTSKIVTNASGDSNSSFNGYYTWPRLGYDGPLEEKHTSNLPDKYKSAKTVQELVSMPGGMDAWKEHGRDIELSFDLKPGSNSMKILKDYLEAKKAKLGKKHYHYHLTKSMKSETGNKGGDQPDLSPEDEEALDEAWKKLSEKDRPTSLKDKYSKKYLGLYGKKDGFSGQKEDSLGRTICYTEGHRISCNKPEAPKVEKENGGLKEKVNETKSEAETDYKENGTKAKAFINWFGDWENDPENASKVVDEEGKPLVVHHGTDHQFDEFAEAANAHTKLLGINTYFFTPNKAVASTYTTRGKGNLVSAYLSLKNPLIVHVESGDWTEALGEIQDRLTVYVGPKDKEYQQRKEAIFSNYDPEEIDTGYVQISDEEQMELSRLADEAHQETMAIRKRLKLGPTQKPPAWEIKEDGIIVRGSMDMTDRGVNEDLATEGEYNPYADIYIAFKPNQIKAKDNIGTFDPNSANFKKNYPLT